MEVNTDGIEEGAKKQLGKMVALGVVGLLTVIGAIYGVVKFLPLIDGVLSAEKQIVANTEKNVSHSAAIVTLREELQRMDNKISRTESVFVSLEKSDNSLKALEARIGDDEKNLRELNAWRSSAEESLERHSVEIEANTVGRIEQKGRAGSRAATREERYKQIDEHDRSIQELSERIHDTQKTIQENRISELEARIKKLESNSE